MSEKLEKKDLEWIADNLSADPAALRLKAAKSGFKESAILQIECRQKAAKKLPRTLAERRFVFPTALSAEQCTSEALAEFHAGLLDGGETLLDLTAGLGIDSFHFAGKASRVTAVEIDPVLAEALRENARTLSLDNLTVVCRDCREFLRETPEGYAVVFADPARPDAGGRRVYALADCSPDVTGMMETISAKCRRLILKASPMLDPTRTLRELPGAAALYAVGTPAECRELLVLADFDRSAAQSARLHCATLAGEETAVFSFTAEEERAARVRYSIPAEGDYLYEPYPSVMKMQPFKLLCQRFGLGKLHANTHLYSSRDRIEGFPGEALKILEIRKFSSREISQMAKSRPLMEVAVRNFPLTARELGKRLKAKEDRRRRLLATTLADGSRRLVICARTS